MWEIMKTKKSKTLRKPSECGKITGVLTKRAAKAQGKREAARITKRVRSLSAAKTMDENLKKLQFYDEN